MRVALFTESFDPVINGVSTSVKTLAAELVRAGHDPVIIAPRYPDYEDVDSASDGIEVRRLPSWRTLLNPENPFAYPPTGLYTPRAYRDGGFAIVHTQQPFGMGLHGRVCARRSGAALVSTFHTLYQQYVHYAPFAPPQLVRAVVSRHLGRYYASCDAVVVPSRAAGRVLEGLGVPSGLLHVVPTGVPATPSVMPAAVEQMRKTFSLPPHAPVLLYVGRLAREKSMNLLIDAFARVSAAHPKDDPATHPILLIVGSGPDLGRCRDRVRRVGMEAYVRFAGFLKRSQLAPVYAAATLFTFPSATETQGVVLSEAQGHGLPCVVVDGGGSPEFVRAGVDALVVPPGDTEAFAAAVRRLLADHDLRRSFSAAALASPLRPTPEAMAAAMIEVYRSVLAERAAGASGRSAPAVPEREQTREW
jgi:Glycosyltransferase